MREKESEELNSEVKRIKNELKKYPSNCRYCVWDVESGKEMFVCKHEKKQEKGGFFKSRKPICTGKCELYEKPYPQILEEILYARIRSKIKEITIDLPKYETTEQLQFWINGYMKCQEDVLGIIEDMSKSLEE